MCYVLPSREINMENMKLSKSTWIFLWVMICSCITTSGLVSAAEKDADKAEVKVSEKILHDADALINSGKPAEAYALLSPLDFDYSGNARFDYLLGIAALDSGHADKATLVFERVLAVDPSFAGARLDMARAYFQLGDMVRAKTEFDEVMKQSPPEAARATIQKYLAAIDAKMHALDSHITGYLESAFGHDTNANTATSQTLVPIPALGNLPITLSRTSRQSSDDYLGFNGGVNITQPVSQTTELYAGLDARQRSYLSINDFNSATANANAGGVFTLSQQDSLKLGLLGGTYYLYTAHYFDSLGYNGEWRHVFSPANQVTVFAQENGYRFGDPNGNQRFDQEIQGANWTHVMKDGKSTLFASLFHGQEYDVTGQRPDGGKVFNGLRLGGQYAWHDKTEIFANVGVNDGYYGKENAFFLNTRHDTLTDATIGVAWHWEKQWTLRPQVTWSSNQSNIVIYSYDRTDALVALRYDFK
jgi:tetratricopeptide (TPR) repeat protein